MTQEQRLSFIGISLALFLAALDQTIVTTALPRITEELGGLNYYAWVVTAYLLASVLGLPFFGRLIELFPAKWVLLAAVCIFLAGSVLSGLAPSIEALIAFRFLQGFGGGGNLALTVTLIALLFPSRERGKRQGMMGAVFGISSVAGPWLGGLLTDLFSWRWIFYINVPVGIVAVIFIVGFMPRLQPEQRGRFDLLGVLLLALWVVPLVLTLSLGGTSYPWFSGQIGGMVAFALAALLLFLWWQRRGADPLVDLSLFQARVFRWAVVGSLFFGGAFLGSVVFLPLYLVHMKGFSATNAGLSITPLVMGVVVGSVTGGQIASRTGRYKLPLLGSLCVGIVAFAAFAFNLRVVTPLWQVIPLMVLIGICLGPSLPLYTLAVQNAVPRNRLGTATSTLQFVRQVGSTASIALMGAVLASVITATAAAHLPGNMQTQLGTLALGEEAGNIGNLAAQVEARFAELERQFVAALAGDEAVRLALLADPALPPELANLLRPGNVREQARQGAATVQGQRQQVIRQAQAELRKRGAEVAKALSSAVNTGITAAVQRVYVFATALMLFSFLAALRLPDHELGGAAQSRRSEVP